MRPSLLAPPARGAAQRSAAQPGGQGARQAEPGDMSGTRAPPKPGVVFSNAELAPSCQHCLVLPATRRCNDCKAVHYCGQACQRADWKRHWLECDEWLDGKAAAHFAQTKSLLLKGEGSLDKQLYNASQLGRVRAVERLLLLGADVHYSFKGVSPIHVAAGYGHLPSLKLLLAAGARADQATDNKWGYAPLHYAAKHSQMKVIDALIEAGASASQKDKNGFTPIDQAKHYKRFTASSHLAAKAEEQRLAAEAAAAAAVKAAAEAAAEAEAAAIEAEAARQRAIDELLAEEDRGKARAQAQGGKSKGKGKAKAKGGSK